MTIFQIFFELLPVRANDFCILLYLNLSLNRRRYLFTLKNKLQLHNISDVAYQIDVYGMQHIVCCTTDSAFFDAYEETLRLSKTLNFTV